MCRSSPPAPALAAPPGAQPRPHARAGYSLIEVMVGMSLFVMLALGLVSMTFQVRSTAEENVYQSTALALGQAYIEQLRSTDFATLSGIAGGSGDALVLINTAGDTIVDEAGEALNNGDWAREQIFLDETETGQPRQPMTFRFRTLLSDLAPLTGGRAAGVEITLLVETTYNYGVSRTYRTSLRTVRSDVPTY